MSIADRPCYTEIAHTSAEFVLAILSMVLHGGIESIIFIIMIGPASVMHAKHAQFSFCIYIMIDKIAVGSCAALY